MDLDVAHGLVKLRDFLNKFGVPLSVLTDEALVVSYLEPLSPLSCNANRWLQMKFPDAYEKFSSSTITFSDKEKILSLFDKKVYTSGVRASELKMTKTVADHARDITRKGEFARPYIDTPGVNFLIDEIMAASIPKKDVIVKNGLRWDSEGLFRGSRGIWQLAVDMDSKTILHFLFKSKAK